MFTLGGVWAQYYRAHTSFGELMRGNTFTNSPRGASRFCKYTFRKGYQNHIISTVGAKHLGDNLGNLTDIYLSKCFALSRDRR